MADSTIAVLLIEDNPGDARLIREILAEETSANFLLEHADRLDTGLERLDAGGIDVVLLDLSLPDSHGLDTFQQARDRAPGVPIIVLTALDDHSVAAETLQTGGQDFLVKSYLTYATLHRAIRNAIERQRADEESRRASEATGQVKDQLLAALADELRTTLKPMLESARALLDDPVRDVELASTLDLVRLHVEKIVQLIDGFLTATPTPEP